MPLRFYPSRPSRAEEPNPEIVWSIDGWPPQIKTPSFGEDDVAEEPDDEQ